MKIYDDRDVSDPETEEEEDGEKKLLKERSFIPKFLSPPPRFVNVPSRSSIYTEFYPPDLTKFNLEECKVDNQQTFCMTSAWRVISFFVVVFILPTLLISIPLYARYHLYHVKMLSFTDGDMRSFHKDVSSFWCRGQRVISNGTFHAYLTSDVRRVKNVRRVSNLSSEVLLTHDDVEEWGIHLIKGSSFTFSTCSRWPGGTLLVVKGEKNMRRCFYKEERAFEQITDDNQKVPKAAGFPEGVTNKHVELHNEETEGGEVFEESEQLTDQDIIHQLYSSNRNVANRQVIKTINYTLEVDSNPQTATEETDIEKKISKKKRKMGRNNKKRKGRKKGRKGKRNEDMMDEDISKEKVKRSAHYPSSFLNTTKSGTMSIPVHDGLFTFNINDTLDIKTGNSSFSSSEEFLRQCSNTIISIDLSPYIDCNQRASVNSPDDTMRWKFRVNETDNYYFIFTSDNSIEANIVSFRLLLERRLYDVSENLDMCANKSECVFPFSFMKSEGIIVDFDEHYENISRLENLNNYELTLICQPRSMVYTVFILLVPFIIIMFAFR